MDLRERWVSGGPLRPLRAWPSSSLLLPAPCHRPGGRHMVSELLNRKSGCRSSQIPFHVVSLIPPAGFQKRFTVSVLQSYAPFNVGVFQEVGGEQLQSKHVCFTSASCGLRGPGRGGSNVASRLRGLGGCSRPAGRGEPGAPLASPPLPASLPASLSCPSLHGARPSQWGRCTLRPAPSHLVSPSNDAGHCTSSCSPDTGS